MVICDRLAAINGNNAMTATVTPTQDTIYTAVRTFILSLISCEVVQGLGNGVPMPLNAFIAMTATLQNRLSTNVDSYPDTTASTGSKEITQATQYSVQIDCYGASSSDWATLITAMFRDEYAVSVMGDSVTPLYADDPKQMVMIDGEQQYEQRWMIQAVVQYNPVITITQDYADALNVSVVSVDVVYPA